MPALAGCGNRGDSKCNVLGMILAVLDRPKALEAHAQSLDRFVLELAFAPFKLMGRVVLCANLAREVHLRKLQRLKPDHHFAFPPLWVKSFFANTTRRYHA
jgi:hypothetical protein